MLRIVRSIFLVGTDIWRHHYHVILLLKTVIGVASSVVDWCHEQGWRRERTGWEVCMCLYVVLHFSSTYRAIFIGGERAAFILGHVGHIVKISVRPRGQELLSFIAGQFIRRNN